MAVKSNNHATIKTSKVVMLLLLFSCHECLTEVALSEQGSQSSIEHFYV